ncbi:MAG: hypothetical protein NVSMB2_10970 [Chloroflexota bacterium]
MSNVELFALGVLVTLLTAAALAPLIWAAIQDGRYNDQQQELYRDDALHVAGSATPAPAAGVPHAP